MFFPQLGLILKRKRPEGQSVSNKIASAQQNEGEHREGPIAAWCLHRNQECRFTRSRKIFGVKRAQGLWSIRFRTWISVEAKITTSESLASTNKTGPHFSITGLESRDYKNQISVK